MSVTVAEIRERTYKPVDAWWTVFVVDPVAARVLWVLVRVAPGLSPHHVTTVSLLCGLAAGGLFAAGELVAGAVVFQLSFLADCVDGKLARLQGRASALGGFYDGLVNHAVYLAGLGGLLAHLAGGADDTTIPATAAAVVALMALRALTLHANLHLRKASATWPPFPPPTDSWLARHRLLLPFSFPDKQLVLFTLGPVLGLVWVGVAVNVVLEVALLARKLRRVVTGLAALPPTGGDDIE